MDLRYAYYVYNIFKLMTRKKTSIDIFNSYRELRSKVSFRKTHVNSLLVVVVDIRQVIRTFIYIDIG